MALIVGNSLPNFLKGTNGKDVIKGLGSLDALYGYGGADSLYGGTGNDLVFGGKGKDKLWGNSGNDLFRFKNGDGFYNSGTGKWDDVVYDYQDNKDAFDVPGPGGFGGLTITKIFDGPQGTGTQVSFDGTNSGFFVKNFVGNFSADDFV
jgi:Ca2+-binding RTX toxin-like protein